MITDDQIKLMIGSLLHDIGKVVYRSGDGRNHSQSGYEYLKNEAHILDDEILKYIATNIKSNIRELEGALNKLLAYSNLEQTEITMEVAMKELQNIISPDKPREITPQLIIDVVCEHFHITKEQMISKSRSNDIAKPRQIAMYLCKNMTGVSLENIGELLGGRDHSTVIHGINKVEAELQTNEATVNLLNTIKKKINPN